MLLLVVLPRPHPAAIEVLIIPWLVDLVSCTDHPIVVRLIVALTLCFVPVAAMGLLLALVVVGVLLLVVIMIALSEGLRSVVLVLILMLLILRVVLIVARLLLVHMVEGYLVLILVA